MRKRSVFRVALPSFDERNARVTIERFFLCGVQFKANSLIKLRDYACTELQGKAYVLPNQSQPSICTFADSPSTDFLNCNALVTNKPNLFLVIKTTDSVPLLLSDHINRVIGIASVDLNRSDKLIQNTVLKMLESGADSKYINAVLGPYMHDEYNNMGNRLFSHASVRSAKHPPHECAQNLHNYLVKSLEKTGVQNIQSVDIHTHLVRKEHILDNSDTSGEDGKTYNISMVSICTTENSWMGIQHENTMDWNNFIHDISKVSDKFAYPCHNIKTPARDFKPNIRSKVVPYNKASCLSAGDLDFIKGADPDFLRKIKRGKINIDKILDLHGETVESAYRKTIGFIVENYLRNFRCLLIIVGKGRTGDAVIKTGFVSWLENNTEVRGLIKFVAEALPHHGGEGAYYVFLRKKKTSNE